MWKDTRVLVSKSVISARVRALALEIKEYAAAQSDPIILVCVTVGGFYLLHRLMETGLLGVRSYELDFVSVKSYGSDQVTNGTPRIGPSSLDPKGRRVVILDDIADTRNTLAALHAYFSERGASQVESCVLINKPARIEYNLRVRWVGVTIEDIWVAGCGMDAGSARGDTTDRNIDHLICSADDLPVGRDGWTVPK